MERRRAEVVECADHEQQERTDVIKSWRCLLCAACARRCNRRARGAKNKGVRREGARWKEIYLDRCKCLNAPMRQIDQLSAGRADGNNNR